MNEIQESKQMTLEEMAAIVETFIQEFNELCKIESDAPDTWVNRIKRKLNLRVSLWEMRSGKNAPTWLKAALWGTQAGAGLIDKAREIALLCQLLGKMEMTEDQKKDLLLTIKCWRLTLNTTYSPVVKRVIGILILRLKG